MREARRARAAAVDARLVAVLDAVRTRCARGATSAAVHARLVAVLHAVRARRTRVARRAAAVDARLRAVPNPVVTRARRGGGVPLGRDVAAGEAQRDGDADARTRAPVHASRRHRRDGALGVTPGPRGGGRHVFSRRVGGFERCAAQIAPVRRGLLADEAHAVVVRDGVVVGKIDVGGDVAGASFLDARQIFVDVTQIVGDDVNRRSHRADDEGRAARGYVGGGNRARVEGGGRDDAGAERGALVGRDRRRRSRRLVAEHGDVQAVGLVRLAACPQHAAGRNGDGG